MIIAKNVTLAKGSYRVTVGDGGNGGYGENNKIGLNGQDSIFWTKLLLAVEVEVLILLVPQAMVDLEVEGIMPITWVDYQQKAPLQKEFHMGIKEEKIIVFLVHFAIQCLLEEEVEQEALGMMAEP